VGKPEVKRLLGRLRFTDEDIIKMNFQEIICGLGLNCCDTG
jgi:hypothetical protein